MADIALLCLGLFGLWAGTELTIRGAIRISEYSRLSHVFVGLTILAFGTDLPELVVSINGAIRNLHGIESSGLVVGNAVASSMCQISLVVGTAAICRQLIVEQKQIIGMSFGLLGSCVLLFIVGLPGVVRRPGGVLLVFAFLAYLVVLYRQERRTPADNDDTNHTHKNVWSN